MTITTFTQVPPQIDTSFVGMSDGDLVNAVLEEKRRIEAGIERANDRQMVEEWLSLVSPTGSEQTAITYRRHMNHFRETLRGMPLEQVDERLLSPGPTPKIEAWALSLRAQVQDDQMALSTYNVAVACLGSFFKWASQPTRRARTGIPLNPVPTGLQLKKAPQRARSLSLEQLAKVRTGARQVRHSISANRDANIIRLVYLLGTRATESVNLRWSDVVEVEEGLAIHIRPETAKGRKERWIAIHKPVVETLEALRSAQQESVWIMPNRGNPACHISRQGLWKICNRAGKKAGVRAHPHALRHTHATVSYAKTKDVIHVQATLGHADPGVTLNMYVDQLVSDSSTKHLE